MQDSPPQETRELVALACLVHLAGRKRARTLLAEESSAQSALARLDASDRYLDEFVTTVERHPFHLVPHHDPRFPQLLREIPDPPLLLYVMGDPEVLRQPAVAVVGARRCSRSGAGTAERIARELAALGISVVSGLALGIDTAAHRGALQCGRTAAVLGTGLARIYPALNRALASEIVASGGLLISEHPPEQSARSRFFPERNRLISGLSLGVLVVEAGERSGSLITARLALEQGRDVMAVPGSINNPAARGCHRLLRQGAALVESVADVVEALGLVSAATGPAAETSIVVTKPDTPELAELLELLGTEATNFDALCAHYGAGPDVVAGRLIELELAGFVEAVAGGYIRRAFSGP